MMPLIIIDHGQCWFKQHISLYHNGVIFHSLEYNTRISNTDINPWNRFWSYNPDNKVHGANMGPTWVLSAQMGPCWSHEPCIRDIYYYNHIFLGLMSWLRNWYQAEDWLMAMYSNKNNPSSVADFFVGMLYTMWWAPQPAMKGLHRILCTWNTTHQRHHSPVWDRGCIQITTNNLICHSCKTVVFRQWILEK